MDYTFTYPIYEENNESDLELATEYLFNRVLLSKSSPIYLDSDIPEYVLSNYKFRKRVISNVYGVNTISMANFYTVEDKFMQRYFAYIYRYMALSGLNTRMIYFTPNSLTIPAIQIKAEEGEYFTQLHQYKPNIKWNLNYIKGDYSRNLTNPINNLLHFYIEIQDCKNIEFLKELNFIFFNCKYDKLLKERDKDIFDNIMIQLLPAMSYYNIQNFIKVINKYL